MKLFIRGGPKAEIPVKEGQTILAALKEAEIYLTASCGGKGLCGKCKVKLLEGPVRITGFAKLSPEERASGVILACRSFPEGDASIEIPETSRIAVGEKIAAFRGGDLPGLVSLMGGRMEPAVKKAELKLVSPAIGDNRSDLERLKEAAQEAGVSPLEFPHDFVSLNGMGQALRAADWDIALHYAAGTAISLASKTKTKIKSAAGAYGLSVDIGTTTVVVCLVDISSGKIVETASTYNSQIRYGDDVITRIVHATERGGLHDLRQAVIEDINGLAGAMLHRHNVEPGEVLEAVISGNTTMSHLFWGLDPASIREEPYVPAVSFFPAWKGADSGLLINPCGWLYTMPCMASYVGGDIVSGVLASGMTRKSEIALFMDIGTNGEVAVGNNEWLITAACSAGPCFEGSGIRHGMRATAGAIESVRIFKDGRVEAGIIGNRQTAGNQRAGWLAGGNQQAGWLAGPRGICGSGMIDAVSEMFLEGLIDRKGNILLPTGQENGTLPAAIAARLKAGQDGPEFMLASGPSGQVALTQADIENIIRAKAAIYAGISSLVKEVGLSLSDIEKVYIAGGFGNYLNVERAIILGMLPDIPIEKYVFIGNSSITGACLVLASEGFRREAEQIASRMTYMELSVSPGFMSEYLSALFLPHTEGSQFPTVDNLLRQRQTGQKARG